MYDQSGSSFDYANVIFAVLQDCEHRRRSFTDDRAAEALAACAREKLAHIGQSYLEGLGSRGYWRELEKEVMETVLPQYIPAAIEQNRRERDAYGVWRGGDLLARFTIAILGLLIGGVIISLPFIPAIENVFALAFALGGWFYPDLIRMTQDRRHIRLLNRLVTDGEVYQRNRARYVSSADLEEDDEASSSSPDQDRKELVRQTRPRSVDDRER